MAINGPHRSLLAWELRVEGHYTHTWASQVTHMLKNPPANAGNIRYAGSIPGSGRSPGGGHGNPLQYFSLENPMDRGDWQAMIHRVTKSRTQLNRLSIAQYRNRKAIKYLR